MGWAEAKSLYGVRLASLSVTGELGMGVEQSCTLEPICHVAEEGISASKMLTKCSLLTRLETRTKESNIYASVKVTNLWTRNESKG